MQSSYPSGAKLARPGWSFGVFSWTRRARARKRSGVITLLVATGNAHKVGEIRAGLGSGFQVFSQKEAGISLTPVEDGDTFATNAAIKSVAWALALARSGSDMAVDWVLADDSGLEVDVLGGAPGIHSARYAALDDGRPGNSPDTENNAKLLRELARFPQSQWTARFRCVLALTPRRVGATESELRAATQWFEGVCPGRIQAVAAGRGGFGYDPLFVPDGEVRSFAELGEAVKNQISHRARALEALRLAWDA